MPLSRAERRINQMVRQSRRRALRLYLRRQGAQNVFAWMLQYALDSKSTKPEGYAANLFRELYGIWPRRCDRRPPQQLPGGELHEWIGMRPKKRSAEGK
jgi:hypothetical protein